MQENVKSPAIFSISPCILEKGSSTALRSQASVSFLQFLIYTYLFAFIVLDFLPGVGIVLSIPPVSEKEKNNFKVGIILLWQSGGPKFNSCSDH